VTGDCLEDWHFGIYHVENIWPKIDISSGYVRMYSTKSNSNYSEMWMEQSTYSDTDFKTGSGKTIKIVFKINSYTGNDCNYQGDFDAPVEIFIVNNENL
jgi:hypothetical protein